MSLQPLYNTELLYNDAFLKKLEEDSLVLTASDGVDETLEIWERLAAEGLDESNPEYVRMVSEELFYRPLYDDVMENVSKMERFKEESAIIIGHSQGAQYANLILGSYDYGQYSSSCFEAVSMGGPVTSDEHSGTWTRNSSDIYLRLGEIYNLKLFLPGNFNTPAILDPIIPFLNRPGNGGGHSFKVHTEGKGGEKLAIAIADSLNRIRNNCQPIVDRGQCGAAVKYNGGYKVIPTITKIPVYRSGTIGIKFEGDKGLRHSYHIEIYDSNDDSHLLASADYVKGEKLLEFEYAVPENGTGGVVVHVTTSNYTYLSTSLYASWEFTANCPKPPPPPPPPPPPGLHCGESVQYSGSYSSEAKVIRYAPIPTGIVTIDFDAHGIPDTIDAFSDSGRQLIHERDMSGSKSFRIEFDRSEDGDGLEVLITTDDIGTFWNLDVSCGE